MNEKLYIKKISFNNFLNKNKYEKVLIVQVFIKSTFFTYFDLDIFIENN